MSVQLVKKDSTALDAVKLIQLTVKNRLEVSSIQNILQKFPFEPTLNWFEKVFWYIDSITEYKLDKSGREQIKTPDKFLLVDNLGDCDDYSVIWLALAELAGFKAIPKIVDYEKDGYWDHIYVIVPLKSGGYITLDNVVGKFRKKFNVEVDRKDEKIFRPL
jgi:hypothetical protein